MEENIKNCSEELEKLIADSQFDEKSVELVKGLMNLSWVLSTEYAICHYDGGDLSAEEYYQEYVKLRDSLDKRIK